MDTSSGKMSRLDRVVNTVKGNRAAVIGGLVTLVIVIASGVVIWTAIPHEGADQYPVTVGETSLSKKEYDTLVSQGKENGQDPHMVQSVITDMLRAKEVARQLDIIVPNYLIAGQQTGPTYVPYEQMSDYAKAALYPQALKVLVALQERGGSIATLYQLQYDTPAHKVESEKAIRSIPVFSEEKTATDDGVHGSALLSIYGNDRFYRDNNKSGIYAVTDDGQIVSILSGQVRSELKLDAASSVSSVVTEPLTSGAVEAIKTTKENGFSSIFTVSSPDSYMLIYRDKRYPKTEGIQARYDIAMSQLEVKK